MYGLVADQRNILYITAEKLNYSRNTHTNINPEPNRTERIRMKKKPILQESWVSSRVHLSITVDSAGEITTNVSN